MGLTYRVFVLHEALIITTDSHQEEQAVHILEAVDPLLPLGPLTTNIKHSIDVTTKVKDRLGDACRAEPRAEYILVSRQIIDSKEAINVGKEATKL